MPNAFNWLNPCIPGCQAGIALYIHTYRHTFFTLQGLIGKLPTATQSGNSYGLQGQGSEQVSRCSLHRGMWHLCEVVALGDSLVHQSMKLESWL